MLKCKTLCAAMLVVACDLPSQHAPPVALTNVTVIRPSDGTRRAGMTVIWERNRIVAVSPSARTTVQRGVRRIDGTGRFVIPGLWDMHVHAVLSTDTAKQGRLFRMFLANGVTGVRDMGSYLDTLLAVRRLIRRGLLDAPRLVAAGPLIDGPQFQWSQPISWHVSNAAEARAAVDSLSGVGVDFLKVYTSVSRDAFVALADEARRRGLPLVGHIPSSIDARLAAELGMKSIEHNGMWVSDVCVPNARSRINNALGRWGREGFEAWYAERRAFHAARDSVACKDLHALFRRQQVWMVPTMVNELKDERSLMSEAFAALDESGKDGCKATIASITAVPDTLLRGFFGDFVSEVSELHHAAVPLLAGTDMPNACLAAGYSLHDELAALVSAGLTASEALAAATSGAAEFLGLSNTTGSIDVGKSADMVILDKDPLLNIHNTRSIHSVVVGGRVYARPQLDSFLRAK